MMIFRKIFEFFKEKENVTYPSEYCIVTYNQLSLRNGIEDTPNKIIIRYKYNFKTERIEVFRVYGYSDSLIYSLKHKLRIPIYDATEREIKFPIYEEIDLSEISYLKK